MRKIMLWCATVLARWRTRCSTNKRLAAVNLRVRVAALEETVRNMSDAVLTKQLVTRKVTLIDDAGQARGSLVVEDDGTAVLLLGDEDNHTRIRISVKDGQPGIYLYDVDGPVRASMTLQNNIASIRVYGTDLAQAMLTAHNDTITVMITDKDSIPRGILFGDGYAKSTCPSLVLLDAEGEPVFQAPPDGDSDRGDGRDWEKVFGF